MRGEEQWNQDLLDIIKEEIQIDFPDYKVSKTKVLNDIFLFKENGEPLLQFGFVDQDIVIYKETLDVTGLDKVNSIFLHNVKPSDGSALLFQS